MGLPHDVGSAVRLASAARERRRRANLRIPVGDRQRHDAATFFLLPDHDEPAGGVRVIYRHVDLLNARGHNAAVLHQRPGFRCTWFPNSTPVVYAGQSQIGPQDLLVVSELEAELIAARGLKVRHVVFNQSGALTWKYGPSRVAAYYSSAEGPRAVVTVSQHIAEMLRFALPGTDVRVVPPSIDGSLFHPAERAADSRIISYMPRRNGEEAALLWNVLRERPALRDWQVLPIDGLDSAGVAAALQASSMFVATSLREGFGLPAAEAMACGAYVVGYHGFGGREFLDPSLSSPVSPGDVLALAEAIESAVTREEADPGWLHRTGLLASQRVLATYSPNAEEEALFRAYGDLLPDVLHH